MAQEEKYGTRDLTYSAWHRRMSLQRFVGIEAAQTCAMIDLDAQLWVECEDETFRPLMLVETALDIGQPHKTGTITRNEAKRGAPINEDIPAYVVLYLPADTPNPANEDWPDIKRFRVKRLWPDSDREWTTFTPDEWAQKIIEIRAWSARRLDQIISQDPPA